jgi:aldose 1-epimerase
MQVLISSYVVKGLDFKVIEVKNELGLEIKLLNYGASVIDIKVPDLQGQVETVLVTPKRLDDFIHNEGYFGKTIGRTSGRIDKGCYKLNQKVYQLDKNWKGISNLHGGYNGLSEQIWNYDIKETDAYGIVSFSYISEHQENQFPGTLIVQTNYYISKTENVVRIEYKGQSDKDTLCNLTNHSYFNLSGNMKENILNHELYLRANRFTKLNDEMIAKQIIPVNQVMDFRISRPIGTYLEDDSLQKHPALGYDHAYLFDDNRFNQVKATLYYPKSGRKLEICTTYPAVVVFTSNNSLDYEIIGKSRMERYDGICLECQFIPNGINMDLSEADKAILKANEIYHHQIIWNFSVSNLLRN